jgi:ankyrin repeat protein
MIQLFLDNKADVNAKTLEGSTSLHVAVLFGKVKALKLLLSYGAGTIQNKIKVTNKLKFTSFSVW